MKKSKIRFIGPIAALAVSLVAQAGPLVNGSFETGDFTGFTRSGFYNRVTEEEGGGGPSAGGPNYATFLGAEITDPAKPDTNAVVTSQTSDFDGLGPSSSPPIGPTDGNFLAFVSNQTSAGDETLTGSSITQTFTLPAGATSLSFDVGLLNNDDPEGFTEFDDFGGVALLQGANVVDQYNLDLDPNSSADAHVTSDTNQGGFQNTTAWQNPTFDVSALAGQALILRAYAINYGGDNAVETRLLLDNIRLQGTTQSVPEPSGLLMFGAGLLGLAFFARRKWRKI